MNRDDAKGQLFDVLFDLKAVTEDLTAIMSELHEPWSDVERIFGKARDAETDLASLLDVPLTTTPVE